MASEDDVVQLIDLDKFLDTSKPVQTGQINPTIYKPKADRMVVAGLFLDDSGSMRRMRQAVIDGLALCTKAFRGAKGSDFILDVRGFGDSFYSGPLAGINEATFESYHPFYDISPLCKYAKRQLVDLHYKAGEYRAMGISTTVAQLLLTDGEPNSDIRPDEYRNAIEPADYLVGMGITNSSGEYSDMFGELFEKMGINNIMTPKADPAEVRHAINQFSQSVASIAA